MAQVSCFYFKSSTTGYSIPTKKDAILHPLFSTDIPTSPFPRFQLIHPCEGLMVAHFLHLELDPCSTQNLGQLWHISSWIKTCLGIRKGRDYHPKENQQYMGFGWFWYLKIVGKMMGIPPKYRGLSSCSLFP